MTNTELLAPERCRCQVPVTSKKRALELLSELISSKSTALTAHEVFNCLVAREKLGSTGLGHGVAIPHGRLPDVDAPVGAVVTLETGVDFDAPDREPVDLIVGLIVPEASTDEHLHILSKLAETFSDQSRVTSIRQATSPESICQLLGESTLKV